MRHFIIPLLVLALPLTARAGDAEADWQAVLALDAGPQRSAKSAAEAQTIAVEHLAKQERALRSFLAAHPGEAREFEAKLRLARLLPMRSAMQGGAPSREAQQILAELEKSATPAQRTEIDFTRITQTMRDLQQPTGPQRDTLLASARRFQAAHPDDPRLGALLAEVALLFDMQPKTMLALLLDAQPLARDDDLKARIADDLRRVEMLGNPVALRFKAADGRTLDVADHRGKVVLLVFFAVWSQPSIEALDRIQRAASDLPRDRVQLLGVSLDTKPERLAALLGERKITWPVACDGKGWDSPLARTLGVNALPTAWLLDAKGNLRSLNATVALVLNAIILIAMLSYFEAVLTLPGIAGVILTIGMAVDSNVLIFERIREELRAGKAIGAAISAGFSKAFLTIIDTHVTTVVSCAFLFLFGTGPVKGFAVTLVIGLLANVFTAVFVSKVIFDRLSVK